MSASNALRIPEGFTQGPDLTLADLKRGDIFQTKPSKEWPWAIFARVWKVNRTTFGWEDGAETGKSGERKIWVRKDGIARLQEAAVVRGKVIHVIRDPSLAPHAEPPPKPKPDLFGRWR